MTWPGLKPTIYHIRGEQANDLTRAQTIVGSSPGRVKPKTIRKFENTKGVIRSRNRRTDNTVTNRKRTNNDLQNITQDTRDRATRTPYKTGVNAVLRKDYDFWLPLWYFQTFLWSLVSLDRGSNPLESNMLTITPPVCLRLFGIYILTLYFGSIISDILFMFLNDEHTSKCQKYKFSHK
jgi:hypothetical protein